jgi:hypothetical protein
VQGVKLSFSIRINHGISLHRDIMITIGIYTWNLVTSIIGSFAIGALSVIIYSKLILHHKTSISQTNENIVEAIISEYSSMLKGFEKTVTELVTRIDTMELRMLRQHPSPVPFSFSNRDINPDILSSTSQHQSREPEQLLTPYISRPTTTPTQDSSKTIVDKNNLTTVQNVTTEHILTLLIERPRTSREIQHAIGRTREHTSRLMKRLYQTNLVSRESGSKPFKYTITDAGLLKLNTHQQTNYKDPRIAVDSYSSKYSSDFQSQTAA